MRYRKLDAAGDMTFGHGQSDFYIDEPAAVAQAILTRLKLWTGEWFLDSQAGTLWLQVDGSAPPGVLGRGTQGVRDQILRERISATLGVQAVLAYASQLDAARLFSVDARVQTAFGPVTVSLPTLPPVPPSPPSNLAMIPFSLDRSALDRFDYLSLGRDGTVGPIVS